MVGSSTCCATRAWPSLKTCLLYSEHAYSQMVGVKPQLLDLLGRLVVDRVGPALRAVYRQLATRQLAARALVSPAAPAAVPQAFALRRPRRLHCRVAGLVHGICWRVP